MTPPSPTITTGPKSGSTASPTMASTPEAVIGWSTAPPIRSPSRDVIVTNASRTAAALSSPKTTPPTSDL